MILNRLMDPESKVGVLKWMKEGVYEPRFERLELHHLYQVLGFFYEEKERIRE